MQDFDILLVEDNEPDAVLFKRALGQHDPDLHIHWLKDGQSVLDYFYTNEKDDYKKKPSLVFLDIKLPKIDGLEVLKTVKSDPETREIPIIILSSSNQEVDMVRATEYGVNSYVVKPERYQDLKEMVSSAANFWLRFNEPSKRQ